MVTEMPDEPLRLLIAAREHDPFRVLGLHRRGDGWQLTVFRPHARAVAVDIGGAWMPLARVRSSDIFRWSGGEPPPNPWRLRIEEESGVHEVFDPYAFPPSPSEHDLYLFNAGSNVQAYRLLGATRAVQQGIDGFRFRV